MTYYMISLVITFNNISLNQSIIYAYYFVLDSLPFWYTKSHLFIVKKCTCCYPICWEVFHPLSYLLELTFFPLHPSLPPYNYWAVGYTSLFWIKLLVKTRKAWWPSVWLTGRSKYGHYGKSMSQFILYLYIDLVEWLIWLL